MKAWVVVVALLAAVPAGAVVLGGGDAEKDCRLAFGGVDATVGASGVVCVDGDACDLDGTADGTCSFDVRLCVGVPLAGCSGVALDRIALGGVPLAAPELPAADGTCGAVTSVPVPAGAAVATTLRGRLGAELREVDYLNLCCVPAAGPLDGSACAVAIDAAASGCERVPDGAATKLERMRQRVDEALVEPGGAPKRLKKAAKLARKLRGLGRKIARQDDCGFALALMASHADEVLRAAAAASASPAAP